jgi:magnesium transporter
VNGPGPSPPHQPDGLLGVAADHATRSIPIAAPSERVAEVRAKLAGQGFESANDIAVLDRGALAGVVPMERLLAAGADQEIAEIMDGDPPVVGPRTDQELVAWSMIDRGESSIAVVDEAGRFVGLIPPNRMLGVLLAEHDEDLARLGGYLVGTTRARLAMQEPVGRRLWHRLPWLLIGLLGAMASVAIVGAYEAELEANVLLAFFIPGVVYMADAVGTQTEALLIRGLAVGVGLRSVVHRELITGLAIGIVIAAAFFPFAYVVWGETQVAVAVALALLASCSIATVVAMILPWAFQRLGFDPAFGSGPVCTVIQDLLSILVYFVIATSIVA